MDRVMEWYEKIPYADAKQIIKSSINGIKREFISIGYYLKYIRDNQMYLEDGFTNIWEFAQDTYGISRTTASRWMSINDRFSKGGNSPLLDDRYRNFNKGQLQEMLYLDGDRMQQVEPDMTVKEIRKLREPEEKAITATIDLSGDDRDCGSDNGSQVTSDQDTDESVPGQVETDNIQARDIPVKPILRKPGEEEKDILNSLARKLIQSMRDWFSEDFHGRVLDVISGEKALKNRVASNGQRTWNFNHDLILSHANLFDDYVQLWLWNDHECECIGNFEWFYLLAAIQSMWNVVELERAQKDFATSQKSSDDQCRSGENSKEELQNGHADENETGKNEADQQAAEELDADIEEDPDEPITDAEYTEMPKEITPKSILDEAKRNLDMYIEYEAPDEMLEKQKIIVAALAGMVSDLEEEEEPKQPELPKFKNNDQRKAWLEDYKAWGTWYRDDRIDVNYYKYDFTDGSRLIAAEYPSRKHTYLVGERDEVFYHLLDKRDDPIFSDKYCHSTASMTFLVDFLKEAQK